MPDETQRMLCIASYEKGHDFLRQCAATGVNLWREWAKVEVANLRNEVYPMPQPREDYAGSVLCLASTA